MKIPDSTSRPDREPKKGDKVRDPNINPERLKPSREDVNKLPSKQKKSPTKNLENEESDPVGKPPKI